MKLKTTTLLICCGLAIFAACSKPDDSSSATNNSGGNNNGSPDDNSNLSARGKLLVAGKWQLMASMASATINGKDTTEDLYATMDDCDKDDFVLFAADGSATQDENTNKCANDPQITHVTWILLNNDARLALIDSNPDTFDLEITSAQFTIKQTKPNSSGLPVTFTDTYKNIK